MNNIPLLDNLQRDTKQSLRRLVRDWPFTAGAIAILALGIGANTAVFSVLNNSLFQPHPFGELPRLVNLYQNEAKSGQPEGVSHPAFADLRQETNVFTGVAAAAISEGRYETERAEVRSCLVEFASANLLEVLGMRPSLGRWFTADEDRARAPVAVLGFTAWTRDFGSDPNILGRTITLGGSSLQVLGVGPATLNSSQSTALFASFWLPLRRMKAPAVFEQRENLFLQVRARLRPGVDVPRAQAAMDVTAQRLAQAHPSEDPRRGITVLPTQDIAFHPRETQLKPIGATLLATVGLVLAIACSNLATLLLVRASGRSAEISVRLALGASRAQLVRHLLMESLLLSLAGAVVGLALARWGLSYAATIDLPVILNLQLDYRVLGFSIAAAALCGLGFGLTPALQATRVDVAGALREGKGSSGGSLSLSRSWFTLKNTLVAGQVAASFLLLVGAVLSLAILTATQRQSVGFRADGVAIVQTDPAWAGYELSRATAVLEELRRQVAALPGVESAFVTSGFPIDGQFDEEFHPEGAKDGESFEVEGRWAGAGYFHTMGIPLLYGRVFTERDSPDSPEVTVVSEAFARRFFGTPNAVGKRIRFQAAPEKLVEIVGVVGNARSIDMVAEAPKKFLYRSAVQGRVLPTTIVARGAGSDLALAGLMQQEMRRWHPELPITRALTMKQRQEMELVLFRIATVALGALGGLGLLLAGVGLYAVVSFAVAQRSTELGIRIALGARSSDLTWLVVRDVTALVAAGIAVGGLLSWTGVTVLQTSVERIVGVDASALMWVALMILACGAVAAYVPARRAVQTDPIAAIRHQ